MNQSSRPFCFGCSYPHVVDRKYCERLEDTWSGSWYGTPRSTMLTLGWRH